MKLEHYPADKLKKELLAIIGKRLDLSKYRVFFFGSRVDGKSFERSDIDVGIEGKKPIPFSTLACIKEDVEQLPTLYTIDVVDFRRTPPEFRKVALTYTEEIKGYDKTYRSYQPV
jgi:uncharacterized protein